MPAPPNNNSILTAVTTTGRQDDDLDTHTSILTADYQHQTWYHSVIEDTTEDNGRRSYMVVPNLTVDDVDTNGTSTLSESSSAPDSASLVLSMQATAAVPAAQTPPRPSQNQAKKQQQQQQSTQQQLQHNRLSFPKPQVPARVATLLAGLMRTAQSNTTTTTTTKTNDVSIEMQGVPLVSGAPAATATAASVPQASTATATTITTAPAEVVAADLRNNSRGNGVVGFGSRMSGRRESAGVDTATHVSGDLPDDDLSDMDEEAPCCLQLSERLDQWLWSKTRGITRQLKAMNCFRSVCCSAGAGYSLRLTDPPLEETLRLSTTNGTLMQMQQQQQQTSSSSTSYLLTANSSRYTDGGGQNLDHQGGALGAGALRTQSAESMHNDDELSVSGACSLIYIFRGLVSAVLLGYFSFHLFLQIQDIGYPPLFFLTEWGIWMTTFYFTFTFCVHSKLLIRAWAATRRRVSRGAVAGGVGRTRSTTAQHDSLLPTNSAGAGTSESAAFSYGYANDSHENTKNNESQHNQQYQKAKNRNNKNRRKDGGGGGVGADYGYYRKNDPSSTYQPQQDPTDPTSAAGRSVMMTLRSHGSSAFTGNNNSKHNRSSNRLSYGGGASGAGHHGEGSIEVYVHDSRSLFGCAWKWVAGLFTTALLWELIITTVFWSILYPFFIASSGGLSGDAEMDPSAPAPNPVNATTSNTTTRTPYGHDFRADHAVYYEVDSILAHSLPMFCLLIEWALNCIYIEHHLIAPSMLSMFIYGIVNIVVAEARGSPIYPILDYSTYAGYLFLLVFGIFALLTFYFMFAMNYLKFRFGRSSCCCCCATRGGIAHNTAQDEQNTRSLIAHMRGGGGGGVGRRGSARHGYRRPTVYSAASTATEASFTSEGEELYD